MHFTIWGLFLLLIVILLFIDLKVLHRKPEAVSLKEAAWFSAAWVGLSLVFNVGVYFLYENHIFDLGTGDHAMDGQEAAVKFLTGYLIEKSLSVDNLFVIALIFTHFGTPAKHQHRILFWGILGAIVFRGIMIIFGAALMESFDWITYVFGGLLLYSAIKMLLHKEENVNPENNIMVRAVRKVFPVSSDPNPDTFFVIENGRRAVTYLFLALLVIETTDIFFAVDSIPAIFSITTDPFIVFTSNIFAILGLRSLYFLLAAFLDRFQYLRFSLVFILGYVGIKMLLLHFYHIPAWLSLCIISLILAGGVIASLLKKERPSRL